MAQVMAPRGHFGQGQFTTYNGDSNSDNAQPPPPPITMPFGCKWLNFLQSSYELGFGQSSSRSIH